MNADKLQELKQLIEFLKENKIASFELESGDEKVRISFGNEAGTLAPAQLSQLSQMLSAQAGTVPAMHAPATPHHASPTSAESSPPAAPAEEAGLHTVTSPMVGTFYESPSPGAPAFVKPGDQIEAGQVLCIIEAMKLMNDIESDVAGEIVKRLVTNGQPVEYGQALFTVRERS
jgi:acetyl-CoA carboxylase biotin carboxyl carrier protein